MFRRITALLIGGCLFFFGGIIAAAAPEIETRVPLTHTVTLQVIGSGSVRTGDKTISRKLVLSRRETALYTLQPDDNAEFCRLYYNGREVTDQVEEGCFLADPITCDSEMTAVFTSVKPPEEGQERGMPIPDKGAVSTGDRSYVGWLLGTALIAVGVIGILLYLGYAKRRRK